MDHTQFKANQTAAGYVADGLDDNTQEAFELHMMGCTECVEDVEVWRAIKLDMPRPESEVRPTTQRRVPALSDWRMAASLLGAGVVGAAGGWLGKDLRSADSESAQTVVFNVPAVTRGEEPCTPLRLAADTRVAILRVPGVSRDLRVVALDADKRELTASPARIQPDGSQVLRLESQLLDGRAVHLEARHADGTGEPLGCVIGETS